MEETWNDGYVILHYYRAVYVYTPPQQPNYDVNAGGFQ